MTEKKISFAPFHAINQFMVDEYRTHVLQVVLNGMDKLSASKKGAYNQLIKNWVKVPGFRNSSQAPVPVKLKGAIPAFEKSAEFVAQTLACWSELNPDLGTKVYTLLTQRGWEVLPLDADRAKLPGFMIKWHPTDTYEILDQAYAELYPNDQVSIDDIRLMVVWVSDRLPYEAEEAEA